MNQTFCAHAKLAISGKQQKTNEIQKDILEKKFNKTPKKRKVVKDFSRID